MTGKAETSSATPTFTTPPQSKQDRYTCLCCRIKFDSSNLQRAHFKTDWHLYNLKRKVCNLDPLDLESFIEIQKTTPTLQDDSSSVFTDFTTRRSSPRSVSELGDDWEEIDPDEILDEDYTDQEALELLARIVKPDTCLFCDKKSPNTSSNVAHMNLSHGFFIPEQQYLIDLEGMMNYLGFKVGAGATCLWCNKQFSSTQGVRLHMLYKDHCKVLYDQEKAIEEFTEFYDYSTQEQIEMKPVDRLLISKRRHDRRSECSRSLEPFKSNVGQLVGERCPRLFASARQATTIKRFNARRAKIILRTELSNNQNVRDRLRMQNPI